MPEYLSPGVFIEEIPARLKAIEGVSTSTAGFVGESSRGPVAGWKPGFPNTTTSPVPGPQLGAGNGFSLQIDTAPVLVTSFADYQRRFGAPSATPEQDGYLGHAVRAFFDNGGRRVFVSRVARAGARPAWLSLDRGPALRLTRPVKKNEYTIALSSLHGILGVGPNGTHLAFVQNDGISPFRSEIASYNFSENTVTLKTSVTLDLDPERVSVVPFEPPVTPPTPATTSVPWPAASPESGPRFWARSPGAWGGALRVLVASVSRPAVAVVSPSSETEVDTLTVKSASSFYVGATVAIHHPPRAADPTTGVAKRDQESIVCAVREILPGNTLRLDRKVKDVSAASTVQLLEIDIVIVDTASGATEIHRSLAWHGVNHPETRKRHYSTVLNERSRFVYVEPPWAMGATAPEALESFGLEHQPMSRHGFLGGPKVGASPDETGSDGGTLAASDYVGTDNGPGARSGIHSLKDVDDIRIIACPGATDATVQSALVTQCETMRYRFAVLDGTDQPSSSGSVVNDILGHRNIHDTSFAALYVPWVEVKAGDRTIQLPPSGFVAGVYARTDNERGVWKAPANEVVRGATGLSSYITTGEQDILNPRGVNCIRRFEGRGIRVWGARTLSSDPEFKYVNVRRFLIFMEASLDRGTQWVVFEPNSPDTWSRVVDSVSAFLHTQWRSGALFGRKPEEAFYVRCDETTMSVDDIQNGRLVCDIGVAIVRPAEFVIFRIEQITGYGKS